MRVVDEGHTYMLDVIDGGDTAYMVPVVRFVKREGEMYPGNKGRQAGIIIQELLRAQIDRLQYLHRQALAMQDYDSAKEDYTCIELLKDVFLVLETRAARRHGRKLVLTEPERFNIHLLPPCPKCGHIKCEVHFKERLDASITKGD